MLQRLSIKQTLFLSHLLLVLILILGMSYSRYQTEWTTRVNFAAGTAEGALVPMLHDISLAVAGRSYSKLLMPQKKAQFHNIEKLLYLDIQGTSDYSNKDYGLRYHRSLNKVWRSNVTLQEIDAAKAKTQELEHARNHPSNQQKTRMQKLEFLINKSTRDINILQDSVHLEESAFIPWQFPAIPPGKDYVLSYSEQAFYFKLPLLNRNGGHVLAIFDASHLFSLKKQIYDALIAEAFVSLIISIILVYWVSHTLVEPLRHLARQMGKDVEAMDMSQLEELKRNDEIGVLARGINTLTLQTQSQMKLLRHESATDALTGLPGRNSYAQQAERFFNQTRAENQLLGIIVCDIDNFKLYNDTFGHGRGDDVIKSIADAMHDAMRSDDLCFRIGGEEFVALLPLSDAKFLNIIAERIRSSVEKLSIPHITENGIVTLSVGALLVTPSAKKWTYSNAFDEADALLYKAKDKGRNRIAIGTLTPHKPCSTTKEENRSSETT
ncbi:GGDEF domain-containing protein [Enterovibrio norvegicus]|uniref:GGDEF domain-containing protein n=1 Tax=Enterovibrio norvegicus TaxID=188144 RepID=UPI001FD4666C|nr:diguanylate cyclase [Enterovibrio norvegicus]